MKPQNTLSVAQKKSNRFAQFVMLTVVLSMALYSLMFAVQSVQATAPDMATVFDLVQAGQGDAAVALLEQSARELGFSGPAPGDTVVYKANLKRDRRGGTLDFDQVPMDICQRSPLGTEECIAAFRTQEQQVWLGPTTFVNPTENGEVARPVFGDVLSTYIEETGHSWQEYLYETEGRGTGSRTRQTTSAESERWVMGREYQIKAYILFLDGKVIELSDQQRDALTYSICEGYANPLNAEVPPYGAPAGWPHAEGWPTAAPTATEFAAFCAS